ncbi:hypothetical protein [Actinomadura sp. 7K507]|uniref:hypothetical protein n=1 Tax=Actinomadura sp. 7K507 TaxID=2530365 RepID=UPI0010478FFE|nr:hypothetical protein [Actinomadura sp. 7K507]TDC87014.1 hypothetical protein E1285_21630 [Actinomadura sp. 7K507]
MDWGGVPVDDSAGSWQVTYTQRIVYDRIPARHVELRDIASASSREAWAVGDGAGSSVQLRWDGSRWSPESGPTLAHGTHEFIRTTRPTGRSACRRWIFGSDRDTNHVWCWTGDRWSPQVMRPARRGGFWDVAVVDGHRLVVTGPGLLKAWDGRRWRDMAAPSPPHRLAAVSATDIWGVWTDNTFRRWQGERWVHTPVPGPAQSTTDKAVSTWIDDIAAVSKNDVWAVGSVRTGRHPRVKDPTYRADLIFHWDGHRWQRRSLGLKGIGLTHVAPDGHGGVWIATTAAYVLHRSSNGTWTRAPLPEKWGTSILFRSMVNAEHSFAMWAVAEALPGRGSPSTLLVLRYGRTAGGTH